MVERFGLFFGSGLTYWLPLSAYPSVPHQQDSCVAHGHTVEKLCVRQP